MRVADDEFNYWYVGRNQRYRIISQYGPTVFIVGNVNDKAFCVNKIDLTRIVG